ncbi:hypothetical protein BC830DRAFT_1114421 [Chytriomyces sp. MP71]|nr:hypothetical protein BC830DRAFT_1114421 [Chytriomyces sp. MP71]
MFVRPFLRSATPCRNLLLHAPTRAYKLSPKDLKRNVILRSKGRLWTVSDFSLHTQGRQGSHYKVELVPFGTSGAVGGGKVVERVNQDAVLEGVDLANRGARFLYQADGILYFLDLESMEEVQCEMGILNGGEKTATMITEEMDIILQCLEEDSGSLEVLAVKLPLTGVYKVAQAAPAPSSVSNEGKGTRFKPATLENGVIVTVPEFVHQGERVVVTIADFKYKERAK